MTTTPCPETSTNSAERWNDAWRKWPTPARSALIAGMSLDEMAWLSTRWELYSHDHQRPPPVAANGDPWLLWLLIGGRGAGKTRAGAEWIKAQALGLPPFADAPAGRIALVGETEHDVREVMIEGVSGLLAIHARRDRPQWVSSRKRLEWPNGAVAHAFSADDPESLRGPQFHVAWSDEIAKWRYADAAFDMLQFGLRLGTRPRQIVTTTPRPTALVKKLIADPAHAVTRAPTRSNALNLAPSFLRNVMTRYGGTRLGRQELDGEIIDERPDALWSRAVIEDGRVRAAPALERIVVAVDPPASSGKNADACGIVAAGRAPDGAIYVLADDSIAGATPQLWSAKAIALWMRLEADALVAEVNQGGDMVRAVIAQADASVPVTPVRATRGKWLRAEPVAMLYTQGRVKHAGSFALLEDEMCDFAANGLSSGRSPDRLDALVWAITALTQGERSGPRVRGL